LIIKNYRERLKKHDISIDEDDLCQLLDQNQDIKKEFNECLYKFYLELISVFNFFNSKISNINFEIITKEDLSDLEENIKKTEGSNDKKIKILEIFYEKLILAEHNILQKFINDYIETIKKLLIQNLKNLKNIHNSILRIQNRIKEYIQYKISRKEIIGISLETINDILPKLVPVEIIK